MLIFFRMYSEELTDNVLEVIVDLLHTQLRSLVTMVSSQCDSSTEMHPDTGGDDAITPTNEDNDIESSVITLKNQPLTSSKIYTFVRPVSQAHVFFISNVLLKN